MQGVVNKRDEKGVGSTEQERGGGGGLALTGHPDVSWRSTAEGGSP